ncbi:hypothetical protein CR513_12516, partial [Mucuna pruriens]
MKRTRCKLKKALYGLKQSPRAWFRRFAQVMVSLGYKQSRSNRSPKPSQSRPRPSPPNHHSRDQMRLGQLKASQPTEFRVSTPSPMADSNFTWLTPHGGFAYRLQPTDFRDQVIPIETGSITTR